MDDDADDAELEALFAANPDAALLRLLGDDAVVEDDEASAYGFDDPADADAAPVDPDELTHQVAPVDPDELAHQAREEQATSDAWWLERAAHVTGEAMAAAERRELEEAQFRADLAHARRLGGEDAAAQMDWLERASPDELVRRGIATAEDVAERYAAELAMERDRS